MRGEAAGEHETGREVFWRGGSRWGGGGGLELAREGVMVGVKLKLLPAPADAASAPRREGGGGEGEAAAVVGGAWVEWEMLTIWSWFLRISVLSSVCGG